MEIVIDPNGVVTRGNSYPFGTPLAEIPATAGDIAVWRHFQQIGPSLESTDSGEETATEEADEPDVVTEPPVNPKPARKSRKQS